MSFWTSSISILRAESLGAALLGGGLGPMVDDGCVGDGPRLNKLLRNRNTGKHVHTIMDRGETINTPLPLYFKKSAR